MAQDISDTVKGEMLDSSFVSRAGGVEVALFTVAPTNRAAGTGGTEVGAGIGYSRQSVTLTRTGNVVNPNADVLFGPATASWGTVVFFAFYDATTAAYLGGDTLTASKAIATDDEAKFAAASLSLTLSDPA